MVALDQPSLLKPSSILVILGHLEVWPMFSAEALIRGKLNSRVLSKEMWMKI
jgi:hypothetical protein